MPQPKFDNLQDVGSKFVSTICYYKDEPVFIKAAFHDDDDPSMFILSGNKLNQPSELIKVDDPDFRYTGYSIGYANAATVATWWYRRPAKQYQQGLRAEQLRFYSETGLGQPKTGFQFNKTYVLMLKNNYHSLEEAKKLVRDGNAHSSAWHRDFAVRYDQIENHYILDYRANQIGTFTGKTPIDLLPQAEYLRETLYEVLD